MKVVVACGGTGGHAFPGLAIAEELRSRGHEVVVWDSGRDIESSVMKRWTGDVFSTGAKQLSAKNAIAILRSIFRCRRELLRYRPDVIVAMGSYSSLPPVLAARWCKVPVFLHEANTIPGKAVEFLSRFAKKVGISFALTEKFLTGVETVVTGLPIRNDIASGRRFEFIPNDSFVVFVTGGSQGAHAVNELATKALVMVKEELDKRRLAGGKVRPLYVIHQSGARDEGPTMAAYAHVMLPARVHAFETRMADAFASADLVIARAGASTCFELAACGKASLLIPLPTAMRDHQHFNADAFASVGAADEGVQAKLSVVSLFRYILRKYDHPDELARMSEKIKTLATFDAAARFADLVEAK